VITRARTLSINCRNRTAMADIPFPSRHWTRRLPVLIKFINNCAPSVIGVQETRDDMAVDITNGLGPNWTFWGSGTAKIPFLWRVRKSPSQSLTGLVFQAGHASSILVTRSGTSLLISSLCCA
jgi:hypothetical protein